MLRARPRLRVLLVDARRARDSPSGVRPQVFPAATRTSAPRISGTTISGDSLDLADEMGHGVVALNVWASWCGPCRKEMPVLARAAGSGCG